MNTSWVRAITVGAMGAAFLAILAVAPAPAQDVLYVVNNKVGIGTSSPVELLEVQAAAGTDMKFRLDGPGGRQVEAVFYDGAQRSGRLIAALGNTAGNRYFGFLAYRDQEGYKLPIRFFTENASGALTDALWIGAGASQGRIGIGLTSAPSYPIHVANGAYLSAGGVWTDASSREYKQNIHELPADVAAATLRGLVPVTFNYKNQPGETSVGFIAEDVPDLVATPERKGVAPMDIVAVLTKVVQEQQKTIDELKAKVEALEKR